MLTLNNIEAKTLYVELKASTNPQDIFLQLLFETGARVSEALALTSNHLIGEILSIPPLKHSNPRTVLLSGNLVRKLQPLPTTWREAIGPAHLRDSHRRTLARRLNHHTQTLLGRKLNLHALRHTAFSRLYQETKDLLLVKQWAGHRSVSSTMVYMHHDLQASANEAMARALKFA